MQQIDERLYLALNSVASAERDADGVILRYKSGLVETYDGDTGEKLWLALEGHAGRRRLLTRIDARLRKWLSVR